MFSFYQRVAVFGVVLSLVAVAPVSSRAQGLGLGLGIVAATPAKTYDHSLDAKLVKEVRAKHFEDVQALLKRGADPDAKDADTDAPPVLSMCAGEYENVDILRALIADGANLEATNSQGGTALVMACLDSHVESVKILLKAGAKIEAQTSLGLTALMAASSAGELDTVRVLLANGANVNALSNDRGTALIYGSAKTIAGTGKMEIIKALVDAGADVGVTATNGKNAIATAKSYDQTEIADYLGEIYQRDDGLFNAVATAYNEREKKDGHAWDAVKAALVAGANPHFTVEDGRTELMFLAYGLPGCDDETLKRFVAHSDLKAQETKFGATALYLAVDNENQTIVSLLINAGAPLNVRSKDGKTPLELAQRKGNQAIIALLTAAAIAKPDAGDDDDDDDGTPPEVIYYV